MQRHWKDPRDGESWLVTVTPFGWSGRENPRDANRTVTVSFHRPGSTPIWTRYSADRPISAANDQDLMDFLDAARQRAGRRREAVRRPSATEKQGVG